MENNPGGTVYTDQEKRRRKFGNTSDGNDREQGGIRGQSGLPRTWPELSSCPQGETAAREKEASEEPEKTLIVACKPGQEKSCTGSGLHLPVPHAVELPDEAKNSLKLIIPIQID